MFELKVRAHFSAAHQILEHPGKCGFLHGHNWNVDVVVQAPELNRIGLAVDFSDMKQVLKEIIAPLDHVNLNDLPQFSTRENNPTAEILARHIFREMQRGLKILSPHARVARVDLYETETCSASYFENK